jgi:uncharacterized surface protein with fasciclin (FAS1) repeats
MTGKLIPAAIAGLALACSGAGLANAQMMGAQDHMMSSDNRMMSSQDHMGAMGHAVMVGGAAMYPSKNIVQNAANSKDHTTLVAAVKAAGLAPTLESPGPFTVFAPTNAAFAKLPAGTVEALVKPQNKAKLTKILTYHVVPGRLAAADLMAKAKAGAAMRC